MIRLHVYISETAIVEAKIKELMNVMSEFPGAMTTGREDYEDENLLGNSKKKQAPSI